MSIFRPTILPERDPPPFLSTEQKRELVNHSTTRLIWGEGNPYGPFFVILDNPGAREDKDGKAFLCGTRETLQQGLFAAGVALDLVYVSYLLKSRPIKKYDKNKARLTSLKYLNDQVKAHNPRVVLCLGDVVCQAYFENPSTSVKKLRGQSYDIDNIPTVVSYHPLAVRRRPNLYRYFIEDLSLANLLVT